MRHIVTGGAGFIGSHLVDALVAGGERVRVIDNFSRGSMQNLAGAMRSGQVEVSNLNLETNGFAHYADDVVWHLAAKVAGIEYNRQNQYEMLRANLAINLNVIESMRRGVKPQLFVFASTACVYPADAVVPTPESAGDTCNPESTNHGYGVAKWVGEQMVKHLSKEHNVPCLIVRFFNAIGPRDYYDKANSHVVPALIRRVMEGENPLVVWGSGRQTRVFVDARDIARALVGLYNFMVTPQTCYEGKWGPLPITVNIGHEKEIAISKLVGTIVDLCGKDTPYSFDTSKPDGHARRAADCTRLRQCIGWVPNMSLSKTIGDMIAELGAGEAHV